MAKEVMMYDSVMMGTPMVDAGFEDGYMNESNSSISTHTILYIVLGVCIVLGIILGIIFGKRAANK